MLDEEYFQSLSLELEALKNRVRSFIQNRHWQTDGEWKESVLRTFLRRHLPKNVDIGRGFVLTNKKVSKQLDVLIYDSTKPILFRDGDLVFVTPDAVLGVIEVKTSLDNSTLRTALKKLSDNSWLIRSESPERKVFGLFSFEDRTTGFAQTLASLKGVAGGHEKRIAHCISLGDSNFIRYWNLDPVNRNTLVDSWYAYNLPGKAQGYFIHNIIEQICPQSVAENRFLWYPKQGKEGSRVDEIGLR